MSEPVQVFVRIRPIHVDGKNRPNSEYNIAEEGQRVLLPLDEKSVRISLPDNTANSRRSVPAVDDRIFTYDKILDDKCSQEDVYDLVSQQVRATVQGYNATIFALGCTGSGKTYTMTGTSSAPGIIPRAISEIFSIIETTAAQEKDVFFYVRLSFVELYNNNFRNLLEFASKDLGKEKSANSPSLIHPLVGASGTAIHRSDKIEVRESQSAGVFLAGHNLRIPVTTAQEAFRLIAKGNKSRATGSTQCNDVSSRSHAILTLHVESRVGAVPTKLNSPDKSPRSPTKERSDKAAELRLGKIHLVDLAGSERISMSGVEGDTLVETQNINLSLTALGDVLSALSKNAAITHQQNSSTTSSAMLSPSKNAAVPVPYRNSKLTHLLKDSLGGNSKTIMVTTVQSTPDYYHQTLVSLKYASRAKKVRNRSLVNRDIIGDTGIHAVSKEIERLKTRLDARSDEFNGLKNLQLRDAKENAELKRRLQELTQANISEKEELERQMSHVIHSQAGELMTQKKKISHLQSALQEELSISQNKIAEQEKEIIWLKKALDETSTAALEPIEQLERVQRVADAWQTQAKHSQSDLEASNQQIEELRTNIDNLNKKLNDVISENSRLQSDLDQSNKQLDDSEVALQLSKRERDSSTQYAKKLKEESLQSSKLTYTLKNQLSDSGRKIAELENTLEKSRKDLEATQEEFSKFKTESDAERISVVQENQKLKEEISQNNEKFNNDFKSFHAESEANIGKYKAKYKQALSEVETMKRKIVDIHGDVEHVTSQRDATISKLKESYDHAKNENEELSALLRYRDETIRTLEQDAERMKSLQSQSEDEFKKMNSDIKSLHDEIAALQEKHYLEESKLKKSHEKQLHELHKTSTTEISKFQSEISSSLSAQQRVLSEKHAAELVKAREDTLVEAEKEWAAKLEELKQTHVNKENELHDRLCQENDDKIRQLTSAWELFLSEQLQECEERHSQAMDALTSELNNGRDAEIKRLTEQHELNIQELKRKAEDDLALKEEVLASVRIEYDNRIQEIKEELSAQFQVVEQERRDQAILETKQSLSIEIEQLKKNIVATEDKYDQHIREMHYNHSEELKNAEENFRVRLEEESRRYLEEISMLKKSVEAANDNIVSMERAHEENQEALVKQMNEDHENMLHARLNELSLEHEKLLRGSIESTRLEVEAKWNEKWDKYQKENQIYLERELKAQEEELHRRHREEADAMLAQAHEHFQELQRSEAKSRLEDHKKSLQSLKEIHAAEKAELVSKHNDELSKLSSSMETEKRKRINELKESNAAEIRALKEEQGSSHRIELSEKLTSLRETMEKQFELREMEIRQSLAISHEESLERLRLKHEEDLSNQEVALSKTHDESLQKAVNEVRSLLEDLHQNDIRALQEENRRSFKQQECLFEEKISANTQELRAKHETERAEFLKVMESLRSEHSQELEEVNERQMREMKEERTRSEERLHHQIENVRDELCREYEQRIEERVQEERESLSSHHKSELEKLHKEFKESTQLAREELDRLNSEQMRAQEELLRQETRDAVAAQKDIFDATVLALKQEHERERSELKESIQREMSRDAQSLRQQLTEEHRDDVNLLNRNHRMEVEELTKKHQDNLSASLASLESGLRSQFEAEMSALEERMNAHHHSIIVDIEARLSDKELTLEEMEAAFSGLKCLHQENINQLKQDHADQMEKLTADHEKKMNTLRSDYNVFLEESKRNAEQAAESKTQNLLHDQRIEMLDAQNKKIKALKIEISNDFMGQMESLKSEHALELKKAVKDAETEVQNRANKRLEDLKTQLIQEREASENNLRAHYKDEISMLRVEYNRFLDESKQNVALASEMAMRNSLQAQKLEMAEQHAQEMNGLRDKLKKESADEISCLIDQHKKQLERIHEENLAAFRDAEASMEEKSLKLKNDALSIQKAELEELYDEKIARLVDDKDAEFEREKAESKAALESLQKDFLVTLEQSRSDAEKEYEERLASALSDQQKKLDSEHYDEIEKTKRNHAEEISLLRDEYNLLLDESRSNSEAAHRMALEEALNNQRHALDKEHQSAMDVLRTTLAAEHAADIARVHEEHEVYTQQQTEKVEVEITSRLEDRLAAAEAEMKAKVERANEESRQEYAMKLERELQKLRHQFQEQQAKDVEDLVRVRTQQLSRDHDFALESLRKESQRTADEKLNALSSKLDDLKRQNNELQVENEAQSTLYSSEIQDLKREHLSETEDLRNRLREEYEEMLSQTQSSFDMKLKEKDEHWKNEMNNMQQSVSEKFRETLSEKEIQIKELEDLVDARNAAVEHVQEELKLLTSQHESDITSRYEEQEERHRMEKEEYSASLVSKMHDELQTVQVELDKALEREKSTERSFSQLQLQFDEEKESNNALLVNKDDMIQSLSDQLEEIKNLRSLQDKSSENEAELLSSREYLDQDCQTDLRLDLDQSESLENKIDKDEMERELNKLRESYECELRRYQSVHSDEIASLRIQMTRETSDVREKLDEAALQIHEKDKEIEELRSRELASSGDHSESSISSKKGDVEEFQRENAMLQMQVTDLESQLASHIEKKVTPPLVTADPSLELEEKINALQKDSHSKDDLVATLRVELDNEKMELEEVRNQLRGHLQELAIKSANYSEDIAKLKDELDAARKEGTIAVEKLSDERNELLKKIDDLQSEAQKQEQARAANLEKQKDIEQAQHVAIVSDLRAAYDDEIRKIKSQFQQRLSEQKEELQSGYLTLLQSELEKLTGLVKERHVDGDATTKINDVENKFARFVEHMPDMLRGQFSSAFPGDMPNDNVKDERKRFSKLSEGQHVEHSSENSHNAAGISSRRSRSVTGRNNSYFTSTSFAKTASLKENETSFKRNALRGSDWSTVSTMVKPISPNDQLVSAILDGDVQGIRTIVRSRGSSLQSEYWKDMTMSVLPLHRAISGLHFHGSDRMLLNTIDTLVQLGATIDAQDDAGNTVLHKAVQVCTSTSVVAVVECILKKGASPFIRNHAGHSPIHVECSRVRTASSRVITILLKAGVDPNVLTKRSHSSNDDSSAQGVSPLHLLLHRATVLCIKRDNESDEGMLQEFGQQNTTYLDESLTSVTNATGSTHPSKMRVSGLRVWVKAVRTLIKAGAHWNSGMVIAPGQTQLYMLLRLFPPPKEDAQQYISLVKGALSTPGMNPLLEDERGQSALFVLCEQMSKVEADKFPYAKEVLGLVLKNIPSGSIGGSDHSGRTIFDLEDSSSSLLAGPSCLQATQQLLLDHVGRRREPFWWSSGDGSADDSNFHPPTPHQLLKEQQLMSGDEYVINGVERVHGLW